MKIGIAVECPHCHRTKAPRGRSISMETYSSYCNRECPHYWDDPAPGDLWPGETAEEFGYPCGSNATQEVPDESAKSLAAVLREPCPACEGRGYEKAEGYGDEVCERCDGTGKEKR